MKINSLVKKLAVVGCLTLTAGSLAACSNNSASKPQTENGKSAAQNEQEEIKKVMKNNQKFHDYNSMSVNAEVNEKGKQSGKLQTIVDYQSDPMRLYFDNKSNSESEMRCWVPNDKDIYMNNHGITAKTTLKKSNAIASTTHAFNEALKIVPDMLKGVGNPKDFKLKESKSTYTISGFDKNPKDSKQINDTYDLQNFFSKKDVSISSDSKLKNLSISFVIDKKDYHTKNINLSYDIVGKHIYHVVYDYNFNNIITVKVPLGIKSAAISVDD